MVWVPEGSEHPIHPNGVMPIVVAIGRVVNGVVTGSHNWPHLGMDAVVNVCSPYSLEE